MKIRLLATLLTAWLGGPLAIQSVKAQQITNITYDGEVCAGESVAVSFSTTITAPSRSFSIILVPATGSPVTLGTTADTSAIVVVPAATAGAANYKVRVTSATPAGTATGTENLKVTAKPVKPTVVNPAAICVGAPLSVGTVTGAVTVGTGLKWYPTSDVSGPGANAPVIPSPLSAGTVSFYVVSTSGSCKSDPAVVSVEVKNPPAAPGVENLTTCVGTSVSAAALIARVTNPGSDVLKWYATEAATASSTSPAVPSTASAGTLNYYVTITKNGCESPKANLKVIVTANPAKPVLASAIADVCIGTAVPSSAFTNAIVPGTGSLVWYSAATGGAPLTGTAVTVNTGTAGTKSLYVARKQGDCESERLKVDVVVKAGPAAPKVTPLSVCVGDTPAPVLSAEGTNLKWYTSAGAPLAAAPVIPTTTAATFTYGVSQTVDGCESPKATVTAQVHKTALPAVTATIAYCRNETPAALTATGTALKWYTAATGGTGSATPPTVSTATVGTVAYYVTQSLNGCESDRARIDVRTKAVPAAPAVSDLDDVCQGTSVPAAQLLSAVGTVTGTLKWYTAETGGTGATSPAAPSTTAGGTKNFYVTQSVEGCESPRSNIKLEVKALPVAPTVTATVDYCHQGTSTPLTATATGSNTLKWYSVATGGTALTAAPSPSTTTVQTVSYYVSQTQRYSAALSCEGPRAKINAVINALPVVATTTDQAVCQTRDEQTLNYKASATVSSNTLVWYANNTTGTAETQVPALSLKTPGESQYFVSQKSNKGCIGPRKAVKIRVKRLPALPAVANLEYCQFENAPALTASLETSATANWYGLNATGGTASSVAPVPSTADGGTYSYYVSQTLEACEGDRAELKVLIKTTPKPETQSFISYCHNAAATPLSANGQRLMWYRPNGEKRTEPYTPFTASVGDQFFYVTQTGDNNCESPKQEIKITVYPLPSATISGQSSIPLGGSASIRISFTGMGPWSYKLSNGYSGVSESNTVEVQVQPSVTTSYLVTEVSNSCGRGTPNGSATVTVLIPTITTGNPDNVTICAGSELTVPFQQSGTFPSGNRFVLQLAKENKNESFKSIATTASGNALKGVVPDTLDGGSYYVRVISENINPDLSVAGSVSGVNISVDPKPTATLPEDRAIFVGQSTTLPIALTGDAPWTFTYSDGSENNSVTTSITPYVLTVTPQATVTYTITEIANKCGAGRSFGETRVQVDPILGVEPARADWVKILPTIVDNNCSVELDVTSYAGTGLKIVDLSGRILKETGLHAEVTDVDMTNYPSGIYFFQVRNGKEHAVIKVLKP